jgi:glycosyltransferase involved in cell wall biosynthesis
VTTFIDFRYSRALAAALFTGQEKEEADLTLVSEHDNYLAVAIADGATGTIANVSLDSGEIVAVMTVHENVLAFSVHGNSIVQLALPGDSEDRVVGLRLGTRVGLKYRDTIAEAELRSWPRGGKTLHFHPVDEHVKVMGRGTGRVSRWGELFYRRQEPDGLCVQLTMDWHHLRAGIPLFGTMTAEHLIEEGRYRLRFRSYAFDSSEAEVTDFVRLFGSNDEPDVAVHLTPALYDPRAPGIPNLAFAVIESTSVHPHVVERCNRMDEILVPTTFTADVFRKSGVTRPIHVVSHGVDTDYFRPADVRKPLPGGRRFNFLAVATHVERKNIKQLVRAFLEEFRDSDEAALFLLLRPEYHTSQNNVALEFTEWEREWANDSAPIFLWTGYLTREHLRDFYANANAYVMPSNEGFGLTVLEAMSCATPVIALDHGGVTDFVNQSNGTLVPVGDSYIARDIDTLPYVGDTFYEPNLAQLRRAMRDIYDNEASAITRARQARVDCETRLTWAKVSADFSNIIEDTHRRYAERREHDRPTLPEEPPVTLILCVMDDESAKESLDYLATLDRSAHRMLCLFTRYARIDDVMRARQHGFAYYRWDGTLDNALIIARSIVGRTQAGVLHVGEKISDARICQT